MTRVQFAGYVCRRLGESLLIVTGAFFCTRRMLEVGWLAPHHLGPWGLPVLAGLLAHLVLGPKQRRPVFRRYPGAMYAYAGIPVSRNGGCRGGYTLGSTGSGKTLACILPRLHSLCVNEPGVPRPGPRRRDRTERSLVTAACERGPCAPPTRFRVPPWGGLIFGEKGNEWQAMEDLFACHGRRQDLCVLRTRPAAAGAGWTPESRLNLLGAAGVPADTYAQLIVDASQAVEEAEKSDEFFVPQARDKLAWGIRLLRAAEELPAAPGRSAARTAPSLPRLFDLLTAREGFSAFVEELDWSRVEAAHPAQRAREHLERHYWNQPPDQLGGLISTLSNMLGPYLEPEIAAVFGADSTVALEDVEQGKVLCLAIPQRHAVQRRYVATLLKSLTYQLILRRFDLARDDPAWRDRNVIVIEQDEWQRYAVRADCDVDLIREAAGTTYPASQTQDAVWSRFRSREAAAPLIANLRNRWICQAGTDACAEESARLLGEAAAISVSRTRGPGASSRTFTPRDAAVVSKSALRTLPPFHVIFAPAEGPWLYAKVIAMPVTPAGEIPGWWFGTWNPFRWLAHWHRPQRAGGRELPIAPWRAQAPFRAQFRWLLGLDGTYILLERVSRRSVSRRSRAP